MSNDTVVAVMVTFRPDADVLANLHHLASQVPAIIVVDNGSSGDALVALRQTQQELGFELIALPENRGLGAALNEGVRAAQRRGSRFVCLFDQDGRIGDGFAAAMLAGMERQLAEDDGEQRCGVLIPRYLDRNTGGEIPPIYTEAGAAGNRIEAAMTAGSLMPMEVFERTGLFDESLFIDGTDFDLCVRLRRQGYYIAECREALLFHAPGRRKDIVWFGRTMGTLSNYSPARRYYAVRNALHLVLRRGRGFTRLSRFLVSHYLKEIVKVVLFESNKVRSLASIFHGIVDGARGRLGYTVKL